MRLKPRRDFPVLLLLATFCLHESPARAQSSAPFRFQGKLTGEFRSNITRQPGLLKEEDVRMSLFLHGDKQWQFGGRRKLALTYDLQHYRYGEFRQFTRYDQTVSAQFRQDMGRRYKLLASEELRLRLHPSASGFNYTRNVADLVVKRKSAAGDWSLGYQNWLKSYSDDPTLRTYVSNRVYLRYEREFDRGTNLGAKLEYQNHTGSLYVGSTAPDTQPNNEGNRFVFRVDADKVFSSRFIANLNYRYELDHADGFSLEQKGENFDDENAEEILADDSDFGYSKHQAALSVLLRANRRVSFLLLYQFYSKGFQFWRISPDGPKRRDQIAFLSNKIRFKFSKTLGVDLRYDFETNHTNLHLYSYTIHSVSLGLNVTP